MTAQNFNIEMSEELIFRLKSFVPEAFELQPSRPLYKTKPRSFIFSLSNHEQYFFFVHIEGDVGVCITLGEERKYVYLDPYEPVEPMLKRFDC